MDRGAARTFSARAVHPPADARRLAVFRSLQLGDDAAQRARIRARSGAAADVQAQSGARTDRQRQVFGLPAVSSGQLQGSLRRGAERSGVRKAGRYGRRGAQGRPAPRAELSGRRNVACRRRVEIRTGAALQTASGRAGQLFEQVGDREREDRRCGCFFASSGRRCGLLQLRAHPPRLDRGRLYGETLDGRRRRRTRHADAGHPAYRGAYRGNARQRGRRSVPAFDDAVVRRRDLHGAEARRKTRTAGILAEERPHLPRRAAQKPRNQESRTLYRTAVERPGKGAASRQTAAAHRMFRQLQSAGGPSGSLVRGVPRRKTRTQGVSSFQHQDRGGPRRLRFDARGRLPALQPPAGGGGRAARSHYC